MSKFLKILIFEGASFFLFIIFLLKIFFAKMISGGRGKLNVDLFGNKYKYLMEITEKMILR